MGKNCTPKHLFLTCLVVAGVGGCSGFSNPFTGPPPAYKTSYGLTPKEKIAQLAQLATELPSKSAPEQQQITQKLTVELAAEGDPLLRRSLVQAIGALNDSYSNPTLLAAANDASPLVRIAAAEAWSRRPGETATPALSKLLIDDNDQDVRLAAAKALGNVRSPQSLQLLSNALDDTNPALQLTVMESLRRVTGQELGNDVNTWFRYLAGQTNQPAAAASRPVVQASAIMPVTTPGSR
jgi:HEAT repeat protein